MTARRSTPCLGIEGQWLETGDGERTYYHDLGEGEPLTFLHGSGPGVSAAANWRLNLPVLSHSHRVIAPDLLGFGQTVPGPGATYGIHGWVDHTLRLLDALAVERTWLVGNSLGGWVSLQLALAHRDRVGGIVSMGTGGAPRPPATPAAPGEHTTIEGIRSRLRSFVVDGSFLTDELIEARRAAMMTPGAEERFAAVVAARDHDRVHAGLDMDALSHLDLPVLLVHGREDKIIPPSWSWELFHALPNADLYMAANCGHWSQVERADDFNRLVKDFVDAHAGY